MDAEILNDLQPLFRRVFSNPALQVHSEMTAKDVAGWDSLSHMSMIHAVEEQFGVKFKLRELTAIKNVGDMVRLIIAKRAG